MPQYDIGCAAAGKQQNALQISNIEKQYQQQKILQAITLAIQPGEIFGLLGPNGAGKSTLLKVIAGLVKPDSGTVEIFGRPARPADAAVKALVGLVPQENNLERELTVTEALLIYGRLFQLDRLKERVEACIERFSLQGFRKKRVARLSGGMARRVLIARALLPEPRLLLLDEPTVGLDPEVRQELWQLIRQLVDGGLTVVLTTHYMEEAEVLCDRIAMLRQGQVAVLDTPAGIKRRFGTGAQAASLEQAFIQLAKAGER